MLIDYRTREQSLIQISTIKCSPHFKQYALALNSRLNIKKWVDNDIKFDELKDIVNNHGVINLCKRRRGKSINICNRLKYELEQIILNPAPINNDNLYFTDNDHDDEQINPPIIKIENGLQLNGYHAIHS